jgi:hypothetical protein
MTVSTSIIAFIGAVLITIAVGLGVGLGIGIRDSSK